MIFTTSWDDGYQLDLRVADLLDKYGCTGTFYVCPQEQHGCHLLTKEELKELGERHEVGAHTMTHPKLTKAADALSEITESKAWVEEVTGKECNMFCYPYGDENPEVRGYVKQAGFKGSRVVTIGEFENSTDSYALPTSVQMTPLPLRPVLNRRCLGTIKRFWPVAKQYKISAWQMRSWLTFAKALFTVAYQNKEPWFHLWGHSEELKRYRMWSDLEKFLAFVNEHENIESVPNSALV